MYRGSGPRIVPLIIIVLVVAFVIAALVTVGRMIFNGSKSTGDTSSNTTTLVDSVLNQNEGRSVRWTVRGPIVADEKFKSYQITISPTERTFVTYSGYLDEVIDTKKYSNNKQAYEQFVYALDNANISKTRSATDTDFRGVCATQGIAYMFETLSSGTADQTIWSTTCKDSKGTMAADPLKVHALFVNQIPEFTSQFNTIY
jgi:hypothetical protein